MKTARKKLSAQVNQNRMATGGGPSVPDLPPDPLLEMATPYLLHTVDSEFDSDSIVVVGCSSSEHVAPDEQESSLASTSFLTSTSLQSEDVDDGL